MSEFDLTIRAAMQDDSLFNDILEIARSKGQPLQDFLVALCYKERNVKTSASSTFSEEEYRAASVRLWDAFWRVRTQDPKGFDVAMAALLQELDIPNMSGEELRDWVFD